MGARAAAAIDWGGIAERILAGEGLTREEGLAAVLSDDGDLLALLGAAYRIRAQRHGRRVRVNVLQNAKSGTCSEDCSFCSQSARARSEISRYAMRSVEHLVEAARRAVEAGAVTYCVVTGMARPRATDLETICEAARRIKDHSPVKLCVSLGLLDAEQAERLAAAGVDRYNHNLETSERYFPEVCTTHAWHDRLRTVAAAREAGMEVCCGGIVGLGESPEDRVDLALTLREQEVDSIPVNFLDPRPGTPLEERARPSPMECLKALALFRLANPQAVDVRAAGGREACLGTLMPLALFAANSLFANGYLTTPGQGLTEDLRMIREAGFTPEVLRT
ncbi:MAG: biotin synthase BioB [Planctomycetota bacterium]